MRKPQNEGTGNKNSGHFPGENAVCVNLSIHSEHSHMVVENEVGQVKEISRNIPQKTTQEFFETREI